MVDKGEGSHPVYVGDNRSSKRRALDYGDNNYEYFEMIPDELVILIFTKLLISSSSDKTVDTVDDIKLLAQCSIISKRFHVLVWQLPTLSIYCPSITKLYDLCPKFLKKFKHITSLQINHETSEDVKDLPAIIWEATYRPHSYCLSIISYKSFTFYRDQQIKHSVMIANDADPAKDSDMFKSVYFHYLNLMHLHHMLVSSIKDLENLQRLVVTELNDRGTFILEADVLVELRNCSATNLEQVQVRCRHGCHSHFDFIIEDRDDGYVLKNLLFHIIEWCEKTTHDDQIDKNNVFDDGDGGIPRALTFRGYYGEGLKFFLKSLLSKTYDTHDRDIHALLLKLKCAGNLL